MAESDQFKCGLNLVLGVLNYIVLITALLVGFCAILVNNSIDLWLVGIVGIIVLVVLALSLIYNVCKSEDKKAILLYVIIILFHLCCGCVLGLISFVPIHDQEVNEATKWLLIISMATKLIWSVTRRSKGLVTYSATLLTCAEMCEMMGFLVACFSSQTHALSMEVALSMYTLVLIWFSFGFTVMAIRLRAMFVKHFRPLLLISLVVLCQVVFFSNVDVPFRKVPLICFVVRFFMDPVLDSMSNNLSVMESWNIVFSSHGCLQKMFILVILVFQFLVLIHAAVSACYHPTWYSITFFILFVIIWLTYHSYFIKMCWTFSNKLSKCNKDHQKLPKDTTTNTLRMMMATHGMRSYAQITRILPLFTFGSTFLLGVVTMLCLIGRESSWQSNSAAFAASFLVVLLVEGMLYAAMDELQRSTGGTCTAYTIVPPSKHHSDSEQIRHIKDSIQGLFDQNVIPCSSDSFVSEFSLNSLKSKIGHFFEQRDQDGKRYDTYVVYYCGDVNDNGKWALVGDDKTFEYKAMRELWEDSSIEDFQSRLILILDARSSKNWLEEIRKDKSNVIAVQTYNPSKSTSDLESGTKLALGDFTCNWVDFNCSNADSQIKWKKEYRNVDAVYAVSNLWSNYELHRPTEIDVEDYIQQNFHQIFHDPMEKLLHPNKINVNCCSYCWKCFKLKWFPPSVIDTGHGFKLVKS